MTKSIEAAPIATVSKPAESAPLHSEAVRELSSSNPKSARLSSPQELPKPASSTPSTQEAPELKSKGEPAGAAADSVHSTLTDKALALRSLGDGKSEKSILTAEVKQAIDGSDQVKVKALAKGEQADLIVKADGSIEQKIKMSPIQDKAKVLTIGVELGDASSKLSEAQEKTLNSLLKLAQSKDKLQANSTDELEKHLGARLLANGESGQTGQANSEVGGTIPSLSQGIEGGGVNRSSDSFVSSAAGAYSGTRGDSAVQSPYSQPSESYNSFASPPDFRQVDISALLMEWFAADPEKFKKLMPDLYAKLKGADGKLDPAKLKEFSQTDSAMLTSLRSTIPSIASEFPEAKALSAVGYTTSAEAISQSGAKLAEQAAKVSDQLGGSGYCAKGVSYAIENAFGMIIPGNANDMRESLPKYGFTVDSGKELKVGQVVHVPWTPEVYAQERARRGNCPNYGDIAVIGKGKDGQLYAYNDNAIPLNDYLSKSRYDWNQMKVFNPPTA
jgi:hypothetical protein